MQNEVHDLERKRIMDKALIVLIACIALWATEGTIEPVIGAILFVAVYVGWDVIDIKYRLEERKAHEDKNVHISEAENDLQSD